MGEWSMMKLFIGKVNPVTQILKVKNPQVEGKDESSFGGFADFFILFIRIILKCW